jgi:hypothetical protein
MSSIVLVLMFETMSSSFCIISTGVNGFLHLILVRQGYPLRLEYTFRMKLELDRQRSWLTGVPHWVALKSVRVSQNNSDIIASDYR